MNVCCIWIKIQCEKGRKPSSFKEFRKNRKWKGLAISLDLRHCMLCILFIQFFQNYHLREYFPWQLSKIRPTYNLPHYFFSVIIYCFLKSFNKLIYCNVSCLSSVHFSIVLWWQVFFFKYTSPLCKYVHRMWQVFSKYLLNDLINIVITFTMFKYRDGTENIRPSDNMYRKKMKTWKWL